MEKAERGKPGWRRSGIRETLVGPDRLHHPPSGFVQRTCIVPPPEKQGYKIRFGDQRAVRGANPNQPQPFALHRLNGPDVERGIKGDALTVHPIGGFAQMDHDRGDGQRLGLTERLECQATSHTFGNPRQEPARRSPC